MKFLKTFTVILYAVYLTGCTSVHTKTTAFYTPDYKTSGSIFVIAADADNNNSLEFASYKKRFEDKLASNGYSIATNANEAKYIAIVAYGIDNGKSSVVSTPIFAQTGGGTTYSSGTVYGAGGSASYSGSSYTMPTYGVVGSSASSSTTYTRAIALDIVDAKSLKTPQPKKVYESRVKSSGSCSVIAGVFDELLEAMFKGFPGDNGKTRSARIHYKGQC